MKYMLDRTSTELVCKSNDVSMMIQTGLNLVEMLLVPVVITAFQ